MATFELCNSTRYLSASIHKSLDGIRVMNYAQWKSQEDYQAFVQNSEVQSLGAKLSEFPKPDSHLYEVVVSVPEDTILKISKGGLIHLAEFRVKPENQQRLVELERENVVIALDHPDLISANFHPSGSQSPLTVGNPPAALSHRSLEGVE